MKEKNLKVYLYRVESLKVELRIYAFNKKQANELIELYKKQNGKKAEFVKASYTKNDIQQMKIMVERFGSEQVLVDKQYEAVKMLKKEAK